MKRIVLIVLAGFVLAACGVARPEYARNEAGVYQMTAEQLAQAQERDDFVLVNVHVPYEGDIPGTDLSLLYSDVTQHLDQLPGKDQMIVLYCLSGGMSEYASRELAALGYTQVYDVVGGMKAWEAAGYSLEWNQ